MKSKSRKPAHPRHRSKPNGHGPTRPPCHLYFGPQQPLCVVCVVCLFGKLAGCLDGID